MPNEQLEIRQRQLRILKKFFEWADSCVFQNKSSNFELLAGGYGYLAGTMAVLASFYLTADFAALVATESGADSDAIEILRYLFGVCAVIPTSTLYAIPTQDEMMYYAARIEGKPSLPEKMDRRRLRNVVGGLAVFFALFSGAPFYKLLDDYLKFPDAVNKFLLWQMMAVCSLVSHRSEKKIIAKIFNLTEPKDLLVIQARSRIEKKLQTSLAFVKNTLPDNQIDFLYQFLKSPNVPGIFKLRRLLQIPDDFHLDNSRLPQRTINNTIAEIIGFLIGGISAYVLFKWARASNDLIDEQEAQTAVGVIVGAISITLYAIFVGLFTQQKCNNIYNWFANKNRAFESKATFALFLAFISSLANTYLGYKASTNLFTTLLIGIVFLGPLLSRSLTFEMLLDRAINFIENIFYAETLQVKRKNMVGMIKLFLENLSALDNKQILALDGVLHQQEAPIPQISIDVQVSRFHGRLFSSSARIQVPPKPAPIRRSASFS